MKYKKIEPQKLFSRAQEYIVNILILYIVFVLVVGLGKTLFDAGADGHPLRTPGLRLAETGRVWISASLYGGCSDPCGSVQSGCWRINPNVAG